MTQRGDKVKYRPLSGVGLCDAEVAAVRTPFMVDLTVDAGSSEPLALRYVVLVRPGHEILPGCCGLAEESVDAS